MGQFGASGIAEAATPVPCGTRRATTARSQTSLPTTE